MSRWKKDDATDGALYMREWKDTDVGQAYTERHKEYTKQWRKDNPEKFKTSQQRAYKAVRLEALQHYSGKEIPECRCCKENILDFLQIDHANGDGAAHRREIGMQQGTLDQAKRRGQTIIIAGNGFPYWLKKNNWPEGFQILCANCNYSKRAGKYCWHELHNGIDMLGEPIPPEHLLAAPKIMPIYKGPERDLWLASPEGLEYREKQAASKRGKVSPKKKPTVQVSCAECSAVLERKQHELYKRGKPLERFFCNMTCSGSWKSKNLIGDKVYNYKAKVAS